MAPVSPQTVAPASFKTKAQMALQSALLRLADAKKAAIQSGGKASGIPDASNSRQTWQARAWESGPGMAPHMAQMQTVSPLAIRPVTTVPLDTKTEMPFKPALSSVVKPASVIQPTSSNATVRPDATYGWSSQNLHANPSAPGIQGTAPPTEVVSSYAPYTVGPGYGAGNYPGGVNYRLVPQPPAPALAAINALTASPIVGQEPAKPVGALTRRLQSTNALMAWAAPWMSQQKKVAVQPSALSGAQQIAGEHAYLPGPDPVIMAGMDKAKGINSNALMRMFTPQQGYFQNALYAAQNENPSPDISGGQGSYVQPGGPGGAVYDAATWEHMQWEREQAALATQRALRL